MGTWLPIVIQVVAGFIGGNLAGSGAKKGSLGPLVSTLLGGLGGLGGGQLLEVVGFGGGSSTDLMSIISDVLGGGLGGALVTGVATMFMGGAKRA